VSRFQLDIRVTPRPGLLDPQGQAIHHALTSLGYPGIHQVRVGKLIRLEVEADSAEAARAQGEAMCRKLLANPVTEDFQIEVGGAE
jgi:phosphoribosylformylglycinamidine synthase subunit PurS